MNFKKLVREAHKISQLREAKSGEGRWDPDVRAAEDAVQKSLNKISADLQKKFKVRTYVTSRVTDNLDISVCIDIGAPYRDL